MELPKTEQELNDLIESKVNEATEKLVSKHNGEMATLRQRHDSELKRAKEQANLSAEEIAQAKIKEQQEQDQQELNELRAFKKSTTLGERLAKEGLPSFFKNDTRLLNANDEDLDKVIKNVKKEYEETQPKGATHSTIVNTATTSRASDDKAQLYENVGTLIKNSLG